MDIIIAGGGKVGMTMARQLAAEGHNLTIIDQNPAVLEEAVQRYDALGICGNCASREVLEQANIRETELVIAATNADEVNLLCCLTAHGIHPGVHTIARIRNPEYADQVMTMPATFPLSMTVNPEKQAAMEIERLLKFPGFLRRDTFAKGRAQIVELRVEADSKLAGVALMDLSSVVKCRVLVCAVVRAGTAHAPSGTFVLKAGDRIFVTASTDDLASLLKNLGIITRRVRRVLICGGGRVSYYLAKLLEQDKMSVTLMEKNAERCLELAQMLPNTDVIQGDCSNHKALEDQRLVDFDAVVTLTGLDETNMIISLYAGKRGVGQIITKLSRPENTSLADTMSLGSLINPRELCSNTIVRYVRAMENQTGAAVSVHAIADGHAEAVEFHADESTKNLGVPLKAMKLKPNVLVVNIAHRTHTQIPNGDSCFEAGDTVVVVTSGGQILNQINDIFA